MVTARPEDLPDFENPPVIETVLSVQFEPLAAIRTAHLGLLWEKFREGFPKTEERPPLDPVVEQFGEIKRARLGLRLEAYEAPPVPRVWFVNSQGNEMIQIQTDRFIKNWRKEGEAEKYPRYERVRGSFERDFAIFQKFLTENQLGAAHVNQCEVTYVNHIVSGEGWDSFGDLERVFTFWQSPRVAIPGAAEDLRCYVRFVIPGVGGKPVGRLHVDLQRALQTSDNKPMYVFQLTARGQVGDSVAFFDLGREWIVRSFAALTTPHMHAVWKRVDKSGNS